MTSPTGVPPPHTRSHGSHGPLARKAVLTGGGPAGWAREPRDPQAPAGGAERQLGLPRTWPSRPSRGGGAGREGTVPRAAEVLTAASRENESAQAGGS